MTKPAKYESICSIYGRRHPSADSLRATNRQGEQGVSTHMMEGQTAGRSCSYDLDDEAPLIAPNSITMEW